MAGAAVPQPWTPRFAVPCGHLITAHIAIRLNSVFHKRFDTRRHRLQLGSLLQSTIKDVWHETTLKFKRIKFLPWSEDAVSVAGSSGSSYIWATDNDQNKNNAGDFGPLNSRTSRKASFNGRKWTNVFLAINVLVFIAQFATKGKLLLWGAKINSLIDQGQLWRLVTSSFLHANIGHLMVNCYSLNSIGPTLENICGPRRFVSVYIASAIASSLMSYRFCKAPAIGASGAVFGLVGSFAIFILRHRDMVKGGGKEDLLHISNVIIINMAIGILSKGIDNWGHLGGLLGGFAVSWLVGPAWRYESTGGRRVFADRAPIFFLTDRRKKTL
ncbi:RHOMBOID-like protein 10, chloroplastic isoform X2 [Impatiens glandulifera]|uniref:RHOMBOID-like protein 10, chloroplastic isoform X2 n=1 Tax=Impatiens glandulifera TaxID=253017 RepID=UPI001FB10C81|nr:RHOMBOID-like protein 10, chloroplastic isoform X2 [Impatiens glandulifera]